MIDPTDVNMTLDERFGAQRDPSISTTEWEQRLDDAAYATVYLLNGGSPGEPLGRAVRTFVLSTAEAFMDNAQRFSCGEIEAVTDLFRAAGRPGDAQAILERHALDDEEGDSHCDLRDEVMARG